MYIIAQEECFLYGLATVSLCFVKCVCKVAGHWCMNGETGCHQRMGDMAVGDS